MGNIQPVILAAGASRRFGGCKLLLRKNGKTLLQRCADQLATLPLPPPLIITGAWHRELAEAHPHLLLCENRDWQVGMGTSLAHAISQVSAQCDGVLVALADQLAVGSADFQRLLDAWKTNNKSEAHKKIVCAYYSGRRGVPAIFPRIYFAQLEKLRGDCGARSLLRNADNKIDTVPLPNAAIDIDTPQDWRIFGESQCN